MVGNLPFGKIQFAILAIIITAGVVFLVADRKGTSFVGLFLPGYNVIQIETIPVKVDVARTAEERRRGLSGRRNLGNVDGLLFIFEEPGYHGIWMKDMRFPIDIAWIDAHGEIIHIDYAVSPDTYPEVFEPPRPALYVLEATILFFDTYGISEGNTVTIPETILKQ